MEEQKVVLLPHLMKVFKVLQFLTNSTVKQCHLSIRSMFNWSSKDTLQQVHKGQDMPMARHSSAMHN